MIRPEKHTELMYKATLNDLDMKQRPEINLWAKINKPDMDGFKQIRLLRLLDSRKPGIDPPRIQQAISVTNNWNRIHPRLR